MMVIKTLDDIPKKGIEGVGVEAVSKQVLLSQSDGALHFTMRRFEIEPGGFSFYHTHDFEHEIYILAGEGVVRNDHSETPIHQDMVILVMPNEIHQIINRGQTNLTFICVVPTVT
ncbi:MAG: cupin domain-containing protein [Candidatus Marinimicrobia bacterium]|nr:cupin domain-containing protein [Candidatus Neomarinimicrobiota bacterium]